MANIKKTKKRLKDARQDARALVAGQLEAIQSGSNAQLSRQLARFDKRSDKLIRGMNRFVGNQAAVGARQVRTVERQGRKLAGQSSATGAAGSALDIGITGGRKRQVSRDARTLTSIAKVSQTQAKAEKGATTKAFGGMQKAANAGAGSAATVLDVLAAERRMADERFLAELRERRADRRFQVKMMERQFQLQQEMAIFENNLPLSAAAKEEAKLQFKYQKKQQLFEYNMLQKTQNSTVMPELTSAISIGQDVAAAAQNAFESDWLQERVKVLQAVPENAGLAETDLMRSAITQKVAGITGGMVPPEAVDRIVYDVIRNGGQTSSSFVTETISGLKPEWAQAAQEDGKMLQAWADQGHALSLATPPELSTISDTAVELGAGVVAGPVGQALAQLGLDFVNESGADKFARLLSGDVKSAEEYRERDNLLYFFGYDMRSTP